MGKDLKERSVLLAGADVVGARPRQEKKPGDLCVGAVDVDVRAESCREVVGGQGHPDGLHLPRRMILVLERVFIVNVSLEDVVGKIEGLFGRQCRFLKLIKMYNYQGFGLFFDLKSL